jgi:hypothetical protein
MGTLDAAASCLRLFRWSVIWLIVLLPPLALSRTKTQGASSLGFFAFAWAILLSLLAGHFLDPADAFTPLPLAVVGCLWMLIKQKAAPAALGFAIWSLLLLGKIALNARIYHYGFALAMPATLLVIAVGFRFTPMPVRAALTGLLLVVTISYLSLAYRLTQLQSLSVGVGPDQFWANAHDGAMLNSAMTFLHDHAAPGQTLAVMPEGAMLNFLARIPSSVPYWSFNPPYAFFAAGRGETFGEEQFLAALQNHPPDWILLTEPSHEPGVPEFGRDFGLTLFNYVRTDYLPVAPVNFGIILTRRGYNAPGETTNASSTR